jgi:hypothetical protein
MYYFFYWQKNFLSLLSKVRRKISTGFLKHAVLPVLFPIVPVNEELHLCLPYLN